MKIISTKYNDFGPVQLQDHGSAFVVSYPSTHADTRGYQKEKKFSKAIGSNAWNDAQKFAAEKAKEERSSTFEGRIEKAACSFVDFNEDEEDLYHGSGEALAVVKKNKIVELHYIHDFADDQAKDLCRNLLDQQKNGAKIWIGMCSAYSFCEPELLDIGSTGAAKVMRKIAEENNF